MPLRLRSLLPLGVLLMIAATTGRAYELQTDESGVYTVKWHQSPIALDIRIANTATLSDSRTAATSVRDAATTWNSQIETLRFSPTLRSVAPRAAGNGRNELVIESTINGSAFGAGVLAVTLIHHDGNAVLETDIIFNAEEEWDSYAGSLRSRPDIHRVALHELGHVLGLEHPDQAGQSVSALMNSRVSDLDALQADDINGARALYGVPGEVPANDAFANAIVIPDPLDSYNLAGTNINASRESGEPAHADVVSGHSIWWRWTPAASHVVRVDTRGSNFDTVLAVYAGTTLGQLTAIGSNDDIESPEDNPGPSRLRTSEVEFTAIAGTTYQFAVDGWGDAERFPAGSTGQVNFSVHLNQSLVPPRFTEQPASREVTEFDIAVFTVLVEGNPAPTYQWQRLPAGSADWVPLDDSEIYTGSRAYILSVQGHQAFSGDRFRCIATNELGSATSASALLTVHPGDPPQIVSEPADAALTDGAVALLHFEVSGATGYQWFRDDLPLPEADRSYLWVGDAEAGTYTVVATNAHGSTSSRSIIVTAPPGPLVSLGSSARRHVLAPGAPLTLEASATGESDLVYQWIHDGKPVPGADQPRLLVPAVDHADSGAYWLRATDGRGVRNGDPVYVIVAPATTRVHTWGGTSPSSLAPPAHLTDAVVAAVGYNGAAAVRRSGRVSTWGWDFAPDQPAGGGHDAVRVVIQNGNAFTLHADGTVDAAGYLTQTPSVLRRVVALAAGNSFGMALSTNGTVTTWSEDPQTYPTPSFAGLTDVVAIAAALHHGVALRSDGRVVVTRAVHNDDYSAPPEDLDRVVAIAAGDAHFLALRDDGTVVAWGGNELGETQVPPGLSNVVAIAAGSHFSLAQRRDGTVVAWGDGIHGQLAVPAFTRPVFAIAANGVGAVALTADDPSAIPPSSRISNLSVRAPAGTGAQTLVVGFVIAGNEPLPVLARGAGPGLREFGMPTALADPRLLLYDPEPQLVAENDDWPSDSAEFREIAETLGAFPFADDSRDAALLIPLPSRPYTAHLVSNDPGTGVALVELYDTDASRDARLSNVSARTFVGSGNDVLIAGIVVAGEAPIDVLIRGVGPSLASYGIPAGSTLADPHIQVRQTTQVIASNDNWLGSPDLKSAFADVGAFALDADTSRDAALILTLDPGLYTVQVSGVDGGTGIALVEIYALP